MQADSKTGQGNRPEGLSRPDPRFESRFGFLILALAVGLRGKAGEPLEGPAEVELAGEAEALGDLPDGCGSFRKEHRGPSHPDLGVVLDWGHPGRFFKTAVQVRAAHAQFCFKGPEFSIAIGDLFDEFNGFPHQGGAFRQAPAGIAGKGVEQGFGG